MSDVAPNAGMARPDSLLEPGETAIWWDRPDRWTAVRRELVLVAVDGVAAALLVLAWLKVPALAPYRTWVYAGVFVALAVGGTALVNLLKSGFASGETIYLMTERRLVVSRNGKVRTMPIADARKTLLYPLKDGRGDVKFFPEKHGGMAAIGNADSVLDLIPHETLEDGFMNVANATGVEAMIKARHTGSLTA
jgi:hypothetical protein